MEELTEKAGEYAEEAKEGLADFVRFIKPYMTLPVALAITVIAGIVIFIAEYLKRYGSWDGFYWQRKAWTKLIVFSCLATAVFLMIKFI